MLWIDANSPGLLDLSTVLLDRLLVSVMTMFFSPGWEKKKKLDAIYVLPNCFVNVLFYL